MRPFSLLLLLALSDVFPLQFISAQNPISEGPQSALWRSIKTPLQGEGGADYFQSNLKDSLLPGGVNGFYEFKGTVVSSHPTEHPSEIVLSMSDANTPEVTLKLKDKQGKKKFFTEPIGPGMTVAFAGVTTEYTKDPFMLTFEAVAGDDGLDATFAVVLEPHGAFLPGPSISVNSPPMTSSRFVNISLDRLPQHRLKINDHGVTTEIVGMRLESLLVAAGWYDSDVSNLRRHAVQVDGVQSTFILSDDSKENSAWIIVSDKHDAKPDACLVVVQADGGVIHEVDGVQRIWVFK